MELTNIPWEAISARLKNEENDAQLLQIKEWSELSPENPVILSEILNTWSLTKHKTQFYEPDERLNWKRLMERIGKTQGQSIEINIWVRWIAAASIIVLVFLTGLGLGDGFFKDSTSISVVKVTAPEGSKTQIVLPDNTHVWLNSGAELQYRSDFTAQNRQVAMKGECFFEVSKDSENPFVVDGSKLRIKVYGTKFNVNEDRFTDGTEVTLISGKVNIYNQNNQLLSKLNPGEQLVYDKNLGRVQKTQNSEALTSWINNMLIFNNQPFEEVIHYLERWYGVKIILDKTLYYNYNYTFKVKTESLREVLDLISFITPIEYHIEGEKVSIKYRPHMKK